MIPSTNLRAQLTGMTKLKLSIYVAIVLVSVFVGINNAYAQDPQFTQFYANPLYLNPAFAGTARCPRVIMNYRHQWPGIPTTAGKTFVTYAASYDQHFDAIAGGVGLQVLNDRAGDGTLNTTTASLIYSYQLPVSRTFSLKFGGQATYLQKRLDWSKLTFGDMIDPRRGFVYNTNEVPPVNTKTAVDFAAGALGYSKLFFVGFAAHHITQPDEGFISQSRLPMKITGHAGAVIPLDGKNGEVSVSPNILYQRQQNFQQINLGVYFNKSAFVAGMWYRNQDAVIVLFGVQQSMYKIGYSYDVTVSKLTTKSAGSHEISFALQFDCKPKKKKFRTISCPSF
jgi:type IX secretion system PorP/SprF family membrane protein